MGIDRKEGAGEEGGSFAFWGCAPSSLNIYHRYSINSCSILERFFLIENCGYGMLETVHKRQFFSLASPCSLFWSLYYNSSCTPDDLYRPEMLYMDCKWNSCLVVVVWKPLRLLRGCSEVSNELKIEYQRLKAFSVLFTKQLTSSFSQSQDSKSWQQDLGSCSKRARPNII